MKRTGIVIFVSALLMQVAGCTVSFYNATVIKPKPIRGVAKRYSSDLPCPALH